MATTPMFPWLSNIPAEIVMMIVNNLDQSSLATCVRINRSWNEFCTPHLWRKVNIDNSQSLERFLTDVTQTALFRNAEHIQELTLKYRSLYNIFAPAVDESELTNKTTQTHVPQCTNLRRLKLLLDRYPERVASGELNDDWQFRYIDKQPNPVSDEAVASLIQRNPGLIELVIKKATCIKTLLLPIVRDLPNLKILHCSIYCAIEDRLARVLLENLPEYIQSMSLCISTPKQTEMDSIADTVRVQLQIQEPRQHHALEFFHLQMNHYTLVQHYLFLLPFLETCKKPMIFHIRGYAWLEDHRLRDAFFRLGFLLQDLCPSQLQHDSDSSDAEIAKYIRLSDNWKCISLEGCHFAGPLAAAAILDNCDHIEVLNLTFCNLISSMEIQQILGKAARLQTFNALDSYNDRPGSDPFLSATDFITLEWASLSLEKFACEIKVPWPAYDEAEKEIPSNGGTIATSHAIQRQVYRKLAEQKLLKILQLGYHTSPLLGPRDYPYQRLCLEMTLESGLDELSLCQNLEMLHVGLTAHRIGAGELEWMTRSWPKLSFIIGLFNACTGDMLPGVYEWFRDNRYYIRWLQCYDRIRVLAALESFASASGGTSHA